jgi:glycosyltransferase involved in cell wall biosynthesis
MQIVQVSTYDVHGGAARAAYRLHRGLLQLGEDSRMLVKRRVSTDESVFGTNPVNGPEKFDEVVFLSAVIQGHYINSHRTNLSSTPFSLPYPGYDLSDLPLVRAADLINLHWVAYHYQSPLTLQKLFSSGKPVVWTLHDQWAFTGGCHYTAGCEKYRQDCVSCPQLAEDPFDLPAAVLKDKLELFKDANLTIVTPSQWLAGCVRESRLFRNLRVEVIPYSLETDVFSPLPKADAKESLGLMTTTTTLLFGAEDLSVKRKGFRELMAAIRFCLKYTEFQELVKDDKLKLLCFGRPSDEFEASGMTVVSLGHLDSDEDMRAAYAAADIFILPSLEDNLPNTVLESMSCGTPVVAFDVGGVSDVIVNGVTGQLAPIGDVRKLGEAILSLVFNAGQREIMARNCRKAMVEGYSLNVQAQHYLKLYRELHQAHKSRVQVSPEDSNIHLHQAEISTGTPMAATVSAYLETTVGPHVQLIYNQVLFKALKEFSIASEKTNQSVQEQLKQQGIQLKLQREQLQQQAQQLQRQNGQLQRQAQQLQRQSQQLQRQSQQLQRQAQQLEYLANENSDLRLQLSQLRNSWSWKITAPLRKVFGILRNGI